MTVDINFEKKKNIYVENLREFNNRINIAKKQKEITLLELANLYCGAYSDKEDIIPNLRETVTELSASDEIMFLSELCRAQLSEQIKNILFIGSSESTLAGAHSKISYVKNRYNDLAFEHFSRSIVNAKADYALSFSECCENVFDGRCEFCILPIMNSKDGRLMSFYNLLDRYELKICGTVEIDSEDNATTVKHAIISRACKESKGRFQKYKNCIFEFSIIDESTDFFASLFEAANKIGAQLKGVDSLPIEYASDMQKFFFSFSLPQQNALAFRLFVALNHQSYTPIGLYQSDD